MASTKNMNSNCFVLGSEIKSNAASEEEAVLGSALINGTTTLQSLHRIADSAGYSISIELTPCDEAG